MSLDYKRVKAIIEDIESVKSIEEYTKQLLPLSKEKIEALDKPEIDSGYDQESVENRIKFLKAKGYALPYVTGAKSFDNPEKLKGNIENYIGMAQLPIGLAGPILINGTNALMKHLRLALC